MKCSFTKSKESKRKVASLWKLEFEEDEKMKELDHQQREDQCLIAHKLLENEEIVKTLDQNELDSVDSGVLDTGDTAVVDLVKSMNELNNLFDEVTSWSRLSSACCAVVLDQEEKTPEEENFQELKLQELREAADELKTKLENAIPLLNLVTENCSHSDHLKDVSNLLEKFLAFTKDVDTKKAELSIQANVLQDVHLLGNQLEKLLVNAEEYSESGADINGHQLSESPSKEDNLFEQMAALDMWVEDKLAELNDSDTFGGLPETAQSLLDKHLVFLEEVESKQAELSELLAANQTDNPILEAKFNRLLNACNTRKEKLEEILQDATKFHGDLQDFMHWLSDAERVMKNANKNPISVMPEIISELLSQHTKFEETLKEKRLELLELDKLGSQLKYFAQKQDGILIKNLLLSVHSRWDKLLAAAKTYPATINDMYKKAKQFWDTSSELLGWINSAMEKLGSSSPFNMEDNDAAETEIKIYEEIQRALSSKQPVYNAVAKSGVALHDRAAIASDKDKIEQVLNQLKQNWAVLKQKSQQRKSELEESLALSENFSDAINEILEWLYTVEPTLSNDAPVYGDIYTVDSLMSKHDILKAELDERHHGVASLQESLRAEQGDVWKSDHLQELLNHWNTVTELVDAREKELNSAETLAKDLQSSSDKLLEYLSKVEDELYSHTKLPQDDFQLQEMQVAHQATMADMQEKQAEFDRIVELADYILDRAHPDAVIPIRQMIKLLQTKWFEVQLKANDHGNEVEKKIKELEDDMQMIEKLKKWLAAADHKLQVQNQQVVPPEEVESQTNELQAFQDEMVAKQPDYNKLIGRYIPRKSQTLMKKSPKGKLSKNNEPENNMKNQCEKLQSQWNNVWLLTLDRQKKIQEAKSTAHREQKTSDFDFDRWRKRFMRWLKQRKLKPMEFFRAMDKDGDGTISRQEFMDGMLKSNFTAKETEMRKVCAFFEQENDDSVDYYRLVGALYPANDMSKLKEADQIENEVVRQVSKCTCSKRFNVHQIAENKFRFGDNQQLRLVRILKSTVMVRVGGGWMALEEFLTKNDPCRAKRRTNTELREKFLLPTGASQSMAAFRTSRSSKGKPPA